MKKVQEKSLVTNYLIALHLVALSSFLLLLLYEDMRHWFILPISFCGIICLAEALEWFKKEVSAFDPAPLFGIFGVYFFYVTPILHTVWDYWFVNKEGVFEDAFIPEDWRTWLGLMGILNLVFLVFYALTKFQLSQKSEERKTKYVWTPIYNNLIYGLFGLFLLALIGQSYILYSFGGLEGLINNMNKGSAFSNLYALFSISERAPIFVATAYLIYLRKRYGDKTPLLIICLILICFVPSKLFFGGLRGSRSQTLYELFWLLGIVHFWVRPLKKVWLVSAAIFGVMFMYFYVFFKVAGSEWDAYMKEQEGLKAWDQETDQQLERVLLGDLGRADVQAFLLYRYFTFPEERFHSLGKTYLATGTLIVPRWIWKDRPETKVEDGTNALLGPDNFHPVNRRMSKIYGLLGESILNFGPYLVPLFGIAFAFFTSWVRSLVYGLSQYDVRRFLLPVMILCTIITLGSDSDNILDLFACRFLSFFPLIFFGSRRTLASDIKPVFNKVRINETCNFYRGTSSQP